MVLRQRRAKIRWVPTWTDGGHVRFLLDPLARAGAKLLVLADPRTRRVARSPGRLEQIARWANRHDVLILQDDRSPASSTMATPALATFPDAPGEPNIRSSESTAAVAARGLAWPVTATWPASALTQTLTALFVAPVCQQLALAALRTPPERSCRCWPSCARGGSTCSERLQRGFPRSKPGGLLLLDFGAAWASGPCVRRSPAAIEKCC